MSLPDVLKKIRGNRVVITGGEPTIQMDDLLELISLLHGLGKEIHIESNGTNPISEEALKQIKYAVISPKRGSDFHIDFWAKKKNVHLKFVVGKAHWCWTPELLETYLPALDKSRVWIMPYGTDQEMAGARDAWDQAINLGINYSDRLHIRLLRR
jgi:organic radical activating enzyme